MKVRNAETILEKVDFNNQTDWETYPTADYNCDNCKETIAINFKDLTKHSHDNFSNLNQTDKENIDALANEIISEVPLSFIDFYCPTCKRPVRIYYESWTGGHHGETGYLLKYIID